MRRITVEPRQNWQSKVESCGLIWHSTDHGHYWDESAAYVFSPSEIAVLEAACSELYRLFIATGDHIIENRLFDRFGIPDWCQPLIAEAWQAEPPALNYGRFDLGFDGKGPPKLFEFNCDTPTSLLEASVVQWLWKEDVFPRADQWNSIHEKLIAKWRDIAPFLDSRLVYFASMAEPSGEDAVTTAYMMDVAIQAGLETQSLDLTEIGWGEESNGGRFFDLANQEIRTLYKLYPWEWLVRDDFGRNIARNHSRTRWIEPIWKMIWSHKAILPILWSLFPNHPNLLWAGYEAPSTMSYVRKPMLAREGANVTLIRDGRTIAETDGPYGGPCVFQALYDLPDQGSRYPVLGAWMIDGVPAGMGIREDGLITSNLARFIPHIIM